MKIQGNIFAHQYEWEDKPNFTFLTCERMDGWVKVMPYTLDFELPESFNMQAGQIDILNAQKEAVKEKFHADIARIEESISKLQCLEMN